MSWARRAAAIRAFDGTQPALRQSPPICRRSMSTTGTPRAAAAAATDRPAEPAPTMHRSGRKVSVMAHSPVVSGRGLRDRAIRVEPLVASLVEALEAAREQPAHQRRQEGDEAERGDRDE